MFKKLFKKLAVAATLVCVAGTVAAASACTVETDHPTIKITLSFNGAEHELDYTLYRNMYPNTVRHFIELSENGFYDNTVIHDYRTTDWISGGYSYDEAAYGSAVEGGTNAMTDYLENNSKEDEYMTLFEEGKFTATVFSTYKYDDNRNQILVAEDALPTLIGEFKNNINQEIENGALKAEVGALKMFYYAKQTTDKLYVQPTSDQIIPWADYKYNCATSLFAMQVSSGSGISESSYCVFGRINDTEALTNLISEINEYLETLTQDVVNAYSVSVDNRESFSKEPADKGIEQDFKLTAEPIVIKTIKVTSY